MARRRAIVVADSRRCGAAPRDSRGRLTQASSGAARTSWPIHAGIERCRVILVADSRRRRAAPGEPRGRLTQAWRGAGRTSWPIHTAVARRRANLVADSCRHRAASRDTRGRFIGLAFGGQGCAATQRRAVSCAAGGRREGSGRGLAGRASKLRGGAP